jgi:hypothetical protein
MPAFEVHPTLRAAPPTLPLGERVNFASVFEGLAKAFGASTVRDDFKTLGVDLDHLQAAALLRLLGPRRAAARMKSNFRSANNYASRSWSSSRRASCSCG